ncbi:hypothetical protein C1Y40_04943 [Mycobacterium talmoniae]|uniref:NmrA-like domain-containing protein n=1 Tax=Mycobacterium talmoniae TaxID=1858794 RepID=A0A2S8BE31_9MYCO|nr:hypothetical protein C1Y40_04943 [Mycobacterium talmoniae]
MLRAQGERAAAYLQAQGQAKAIEKTFAAIKSGRPTPELLAYQYLQVLPEIAKGEASKVWVVPSDFGSALQGFTKLLGAPGEDGVFRYQPSPVENDLPRPEDDSEEVADWFSTETDPAIVEAVAKAEADALFVRYGVPTTLLRTTFYFDNVAGGMGLARDADGAPALTLPLADQPLSGIAVEDIGKTAFGVFKRGPELIGTTVSIAGDHLTGDQYAAALTAALGEPVGYRPLGWDEYRALGFPGAVEMGNMFQYYAQNAARFTADRDLARVRELNPELQSFRDWLAAHRDDITVP